MEVFRDEIDVPNKVPIPVRTDPGSKTTATGLRYPGKVSCAGGRLFVSDSGNHRIVVASESTGEVEAVVAGASGAAGFQDGDFGTCSFSSPQGLCASPCGGRAFVADTENHAVREIDMVGNETFFLFWIYQKQSIYWNFLKNNLQEAGTVRTLCGTGRQGKDLEGGRRGTEQPIRYITKLIAS